MSGTGYATGRRGRGEGEVYWRSSWNVLAADNGSRGQARFCITVGTLQQRICAPLRGDCECAPCGVCSVVLGRAGTQGGRKRNPE